MFRYVRQKAFNFSGGYLMVSFYNTAQNELSGPDGHVLQEKLKTFSAPQQRSWLPFLSSSENTRPIARPSDDLRYYVVEYDVQTAVVGTLLILAGGWTSIAGALAAISLECTDEGPQTYYDLKSSWNHAVEDTNIQQ